MTELDRLVNLLRTGKLSRRDFGRLALATGVSAAAADSLLISAARAATPKRGGSFRMGVEDGSTTDSLDPGTWNNGLTFLFGLSYFGATLTDVDQKNEVRPNLAESFETTDGTKWVFKLRRGLTFHDGRSLTPADVIATINYHRDKNSKSAAKGLLSGISEVKADGNDTVVFTLKAGNVDFPYLMSDYHLPIYPAADGGGIDWKKGIGAGPFILESFEPGVEKKG
jgi:peptide/nickel transport system substrate-binding protein